jgi:ferredoxin
MIKVNPEKCIGCGLCAGTSPENFIMGASGKAEAIKEEANPAAREAAKNCPADAISVK